MHRPIKKRKAVSDIISEVVIIAVTVSIAAAFTGWFLSVYWNLKQPELLKIYPDTQITKQNNQWVLKLHLANIGGAPVRIYKIEILNKETIKANITINPQEENTYTIKLNSNYTANTYYSLKLYTASGNLMNILTKSIRAS